MKLLNITVLAFILISCQSRTVGEKGKSLYKEGDISFNVQKTILSNGLTVILVDNPKLPIFSYYTYYKVGGKYETKGITGASHYLEHMMFKGAKKYGPGDFDNMIEGNGGSNNAYTTNDLTVYHESLPSEHLDKVIDIEADRMQNLLLESKSFENERKVVLEERKKRYENSDRGKLYLRMMEHMFKGTPYGTSVIGDVEDLVSVTRSKVKDYFKKYYAPNNATILVVGDIDKSSTLRSIIDKYGKIPKYENLTKDKRKVLKEKGFNWKGSFNTHVKLNGTSINPMYMLAFQGIKIGPKDSYALDLLSSIMGDGKSSYLNQKFVQIANPRNSNIYAANYTLEDSGIFFIGGELMKGVSLNTFKRNLFKSIRFACDKAVSSRSLQKVKNQYLVSMYKGLDTNAGVASFIGNREVFYGDYNYYNKEIEIYNSVTVEDIKEVCRSYLTPNKSIFLSLWNKHRISPAEKSRKKKEDQAYKNLFNTKN